jgi:SpoVK/Ycf46/Vps4 family AAA+-type ATPase
MKRDHRLTKVPSQELIQKIAEQFSVPGGYYDQLLKLSLARGNGSEINVETLTEVFRAREAQLNNSASNAIQIPQVKLEDIHLEPRQRQIVERFIEYARALTSSPPASRLFPQGATALFTGPAGVGKTVTAEAIAKSLGMKIWRVSPSTILSKWVGESEQNIRAIFRNAHRSSHVLFLDEAEGILLDRQGATHSWQRTQVDELLQQIESFNGVLIAASNCPEMIDTAFARRFIFHIRLTSPDIPTRRQLWGMWRNVLRLSDNDLDVLAERYQLSGGQIRNIAIRAVAHGQTELQSILALSDEMSRDLTGISRRPLGIHLH